jgi:hypothetical protein
MGHEEPTLMVIKPGTSTPKPVGTAVLEQLAQLDVQSISPETARKLLEAHFDASHHERVSLLSEKAEQGTLTAAEQEDLDEYLHVGSLLGILQSRARQVLRNAGQIL